MTPTPRQIELMRHALGLNYKPAPWRDYFAAEADNADCLALVAGGFMKVGRAIPGGLVYFHVIEAGVRAAWREARPAVFTGRGPLLIQWKVTVFAETPTKWRARWDDVDASKYVNGRVYLLPKTAVTFPGAIEVGGSQ